MPVPDTSRQFLSRKEAAEYLSNRWFRMSVRTLSEYACQGCGPIYSVGGPNGGGPTRYAKDDLDEWARTTMKPPRAAKSRKVFGRLGALASATRR